MAVSAELSTGLSKLSVLMGINPIFLIELPPLESELFTPQYLEVNIPALTATINGEGNYATTDLVLPLIRFEGEVGLRAEFLADIPVLEALISSGQGLSVSIPIQGFSADALIGVTSSMVVELPIPANQAHTGARFNQQFSILSSLFSATVSNSSRLVVNIPRIESLFTADVNQLAQITAGLPSLRFLATSKHNITSSLISSLSPLGGLFEAQVGLVASANLTFPELEALLSSFNDIPSDMIASLPILWCELEASQSGRFDTDTAAKLANVILSHERSCSG